MQAAVTNKSLSNRDLHRGHLLVNCNTNCLQVAFVMLMEVGAANSFLPLAPSHAGHQSSLHSVSEFGGEKARHNCILSSLT